MHRNGTIPGLVENEDSRSNKPIDSQDWPICYAQATQVPGRARAQTLTLIPLNRMTFCIKDTIAGTLVLPRRFCSKH
jgi:hypothetical protein